MFRKSPYLDALPIISVDLSLYHLREAHPTDNIVPRKWPSPCWIWRAMPRPPLRLASTSPASGPAIWREKPNIRAVSQRAGGKRLKSFGHWDEGDRYEPTRLKRCCDQSPSPLLAHQ
ncbi:hypothetical protein J4734_02940 [Klebsiella pneumoniae]|uniref:Uncharacterized protein n=1 Tax=Klebsiella pneumoniae TaxID=573 RepID=A0A939NQY5_KLEPN|nr:hypothetical protein [Klebsiella pneumoniae]